MSFYEESSIVITPNAYKAGTLYAINPASGLADMDVTRATAATRVDESGLVNYAEVVSETELITNGDFATDGTPTTTSWSLGWYSNTSNVEITGGRLTMSNSASETDSRAYATNGTTSNNILTTNKLYKLQYDIVENNGVTDLRYYSSGGIFIPVPSVDVGSYTVYIKNTSNQLFLFQNITTNSSISIDNVSVKEVTRDNVPRIDYTGGGCPHILAEPQRTNLVTYSIPNNSNWVKGSNTTITENFSTSPDGTQNASRLVMPTGSGTYMYFQFTASSTDDYTFSFYAKNNGGDADVNMAFFVASQQQSITLTNEWKRFEFTISITSGNSVQVGVDNITSIDMLIWGCQCEEGSYPTSYIPTSGTAVTRNQDEFTRDGIGSLINSTEGVLFIEMAALADDGTNRYISINNGGTLDYLFFRYRSDNQFQIRYRSNNVDSVNQTFSLSNNLDFNKIAFSYKLNEFKIFINGSQIGSTITSGNVFNTAVNSLDLEKFDSGDIFFGKVKQLQVYPTALTDEQLIELTGVTYSSYLAMANALNYTIQ